MSWKIALLVALLTGTITAVVTAPVADKVTGMHVVSDFEGKRGFAVAFIFIPAGFFGGFLLGLLGTKLVHATEWAHFWKAAGASIVLGQVALFSIAGLSLLSLPRPPVLDGESLAVEVEVHVPLAHITPRAKDPGRIRVSLYAGPKDNHYAEIDTARFREENGHLLVTAIAALNSRSYTRTLSFLLEEGIWLAYDLQLPASPTRADLEWTALEAMRPANSTDSASAPRDVSLRYRVIPQP